MIYKLPRAYVINVFTGRPPWQPWGSTVSRTGVWMMTSPPWTMWSWSSIVTWSQGIRGREGGAHTDSICRIIEHAQNLQACMMKAGEVHVCLESDHIGASDIQLYSLRLSLQETAKPLRPWRFFKQSFWSSKDAPRCLAKMDLSDTLTILCWGPGASLELSEHNCLNTGIVRFRQVTSGINTTCSKHQ